MKSAMTRHLPHVCFSPASDTWTSPELRPTPQPRNRSIPLPEDERRLIQWIFSSAGLNAGHYRPAPLHRRIRACLRAIGARSCVDAQCRLIEHPQLLTAALGALLIGTTWFFRDLDVFRHLERAILPALFKTTPSPAIWSAGCSDGSELYSVALILSRMQRLHDCYLLGTDCRAAAIERAKAGYFFVRRSDFAHANHATPLEQCPNGPRIVPEIRNHLHWRQMDVLACTDVARWDVVLCRNLTIYLEPHAANDLFARICRATRPGGYIILGNAERPPAALKLKRIAPSIYQREGSLA